MGLTRTYIALVALLACAGAHAGYAQLAPPAGWSSVGGQGMMQAGTLSNVGAGRIAANASLTVGGRGVTVPVSMRYAANAARYALQGMRLTPGGALAGAALTFAASYGLQWVSEEWQTPELVQGQAWRCFAGGNWNTFSYASAAAACQAFYQASYSQPSATQNVSCSGGGYAQVKWSRSFWSGGSKFGYVETPTVTAQPGCGTAPVLQPSRNESWTGQQGAGTYERLRPAVESDFDKPALGDPVPDELPQALPYPLPVEAPIINPSPDAVPVPVPLRVPLGEPVPLPDTEPQRYRQPVADVIPANRAQDPWRVDVQPKDLEGTDPQGVQDPENVGEDAPKGTPKTEEQKQLCEAFPDAAACKPLGDAPAVGTIPTIDMPASVDDRVTFGPSTMACPAPRVMQTQLAGALSFEWTGMCAYADGIRPIVVGMAYLGAVLSFFGFGFGFGGKD